MAQQFASKALERFFACKQFLVVGASTDRSKFGNRILRCYVEHGRAAVPVSAKSSEIEGLSCVQSVSQYNTLVQSGNVSDISTTMPLSLGAIDSQPLPSPHYRPKADRYQYCDPSCRHQTDHR